MTLSDLLAAPGLSLTQVAGPHEPDREVRWAHSTELLHPALYLRGGELVLTVGSGLTTDAACQAFVDELAAVGAAALGLGVGDVHDVPPAALVAACERRRLPLLTVPHGVPFQAVTELIAEHRVAARLAGPRRAGALVASLLDAMTRGGADGDALALLAAELGGEVAVTDGQQVVEAAAGDPDAPGRPVSVDLPGDPGAYLRWRPAEGSDRTLVDLLPELAHPVAVWRRERAEALRRDAEDLGRLLGLVLDGRAEPSALADPLHVTGAERVTASAWCPEDVHVLRRALPDRPVAALDDAVVVVLPGSADAALSAATDAGVLCGVGETVPAGDVTRSVREALEALGLSRRRGRPVRAQELATLDALLDLVPEQRLRPFVDQLVLPLRDHDRTAGGELLTTLKAFVQGGGAVVPVARQLYLHPNTLRHRLSRIHELTGRNPLELSDRVSFLVALRAAERLKGRPQHPAR